MVQGTIMRRAGKRSRRRPIKGEQQATVRAVSVKASETWLRVQPNAAVNGLRKTPNVKITTEPKPTKVPQQAQARTR